MTQSLKGFLIRNLNQSNMYFHTMVSKKNEMKVNLSIEFFIKDVEKADVLHVIRDSKNGPIIKLQLCVLGDNNVYATIYENDNVEGYDIPISISWK